jgi:exodeoxyribonuclease VII large subunit
MSIQLEIALQRRVPVLSVSELNWRLRTSLEQGFPAVWVAGEISNLRSPSSGHLYFRLKDAKAQIAAVVFRSSARRIRFQPRDGMEVMVRGRVSMYEARGDLQIYVDAMEPQGVGSAQLALQQLKEKLAAEGLFDAARKQPLPPWPRTVGVVTALKGAAIHDIVATLRGRLPQVRILVRPVAVQGRQAAGEIVAALRDLAADGSADVIIVGRGGGSIEDLWAFNEEPVARAIARCPIPIVSAVGHEIDVTVADLVADLRAATPTAAAAAVTPDCREVRARLARLSRSLLSAARAELARRRTALGVLSRQLRDPRAELRAQRLRLDELGERARRAVGQQARLARERTRRGAERLHALSPLAVLQRGYAIARDAASGAVVRSATELEAERRLELLFARGRATVRVEKAEG